jgi:hypothetical protein
MFVSEFGQEEGKIRSDPKKVNRSWSIYHVRLAIVH